MKIKAAFTVYPGAFQSPGGGEVQLLKTREYLEKKGAEIRLFDPWHHKLKDFRLLHTFGSVKDSLGLMETARALGVKNVLSTICWYSWKSAWGAQDSLKERLAATARQAAKSFFPFLPSSRKRMMACADILLPNSKSEAAQLKSFFCVPEEKIHVVPNGVDPVFADAKPDLFQEKFKLQNFILCLGRIEPRKNQLQMVRALSSTNIPVVFIGAPVHRYQAYYEACRREAGKSMYFLGAIPHDSGLIASAYAACQAFLLASWLETPGLAALEAGLAGANVVITQEGATREYFREFAAFVDPLDSSGIRKAAAKAFNSPKDARLKEHIQKNYLWSHTAAETLAAYGKVLGSG